MAKRTKKSELFMLIKILEILDKQMNLPDIASVTEGKNEIIVNSNNGTQVIIMVEKQPFIR